MINKITIYTTIMGEQNKIYVGFNNLLTNHDYSVTLIANNKVKAIEIEKINRLKYSPIEHIKYSNKLDAKIINIEEYYKDVLEYIFENVEINSSCIIYIINSPFKIKSLEKYGAKIIYSNFENHHFSHASSSYFPSPFKESAIISIDGYGYDSEFKKSFTQSIWKGCDNSIEFIEGSVYNKYNLGIGLTYTIFSHIIGFEEGTTMGLAGYGNADTFSNVEIYDYDEKEVRLSKRFLKNTDQIKNKENGQPIDESALFKIIYKNIREELGLKENITKNNNEVTKSILADLAAKLQKDTENAIVFLANRAYEFTKSKNICLAGGVALNVLANTKILEKTPFQNIFIQPAAKDSGLSLGVAYYAYHYLGKEEKRIPLNSAGLGKKYSNDKILESLEKYKEYISCKEERNIEKKTAEILSDNKIIGWFAGGSEFGPRALGFRSILASPITIGIKDKVNDIKNRQRWRPLAPILLEADTGTYFKTEKPSGYMTLIGKIKENKLHRIPAITHIDGTSRYQTVNKEQNLKVFQLLNEFKKITGESVLLNTSFNNRGEPIVETPDDAIKMFLSSNIDYLIIENYIITKKLKHNKFSYNYNDTLEKNKKKIVYNYGDSKELKLIGNIKKLISIIFNIKEYEIVNIDINKLNITIHYDNNISLSLFIKQETVKNYYYAIGKIAFSIQGYDFKKSDKTSIFINRFKKSFSYQENKIYTLLLKCRKSL